MQQIKINTNLFAELRAQRDTAEQQQKDLHQLLQERNAAPQQPVACMVQAMGNVAAGVDQDSHAGSYVDGNQGDMPENEPVAK